MRFHVLGLPHTVTNHDYVACAYTQKVFKFCKMMKKLGHYIIHYGHAESDPDADELVTVLTNSDLEKAYGNYDWRKNFFTFDVKDHAYQTFYKNAIREITTRKKPNDFLLPFWGFGVKPVCDAHSDMIIVEPGIGYASGHWARWKIFESYAIYHAYYGLKSVGNCRQDWYDVVIPNYFDTKDFEFRTREQKQDYFLFVGRIYDGKGIKIAVQVTEKIGAKLIVAGQNSLKACGIHPTPPHVTEVGHVGVEQRKELMAGAKAAFVPSMYNEPFGGVQIEMLLSGTPTITTDWGAFTENNIHGLTGYRCRTFDEFCWAAENIENIDPVNCRKWAENFTLEKIAPMYEEYFQNVLNVYTGKGWYEPHKNRQRLLVPDRGLSFLDSLTKKKEKLKIAIWSETRWSVGRIHNSLMKYLSNWFDFDFYDWSKPERSCELFTNGKWKNYHKILGTTTLVFGCLEHKFLKEIPIELQRKMLPVAHCPIFNNERFWEDLSDLPYINYGGVSQETVDNIKEKSGKDAFFLPTGVDIHQFSPSRKITQIQTIGFCGNANTAGENWCQVKRPDVLKQIANKANINFNFIHSKHYTENAKLYDSIDMFVCCSLFEGSGQGIIECAAANIPVISTKVGYAKMFKNIKTFETVEEAVEIINYFNENPEELEKYVNVLGEEVRTEWNWEYIAEKYWKPVIEK